MAFDLDGVIYRGSALLPGAVEALEEAKERGLAVRFVTNNSTLHRREVAAKLEGMGVPARPEEVLSSAAATATWLADRLADRGLILVIGEGGLQSELADAGFTVRRAAEAGPEDIEGAEGVVVGLDRSFDYGALEAAQQVVMRGGLFVATNGDKTYPSEDGIKPGAGAMVAAVAAAGGAEPVVIGKPHAGLAEALEVSSGAAGEETIFVGDRLETDVVFAQRAGMLAALVLTGVTGPDDLSESDVSPDEILEGLEDFPDLLRRLL